MITDVDTCLKEIADWYIKNKREITETELEAILTKHCEDEAEVAKFTKFLKTDSGQMRFKTLLRERKEESLSRGEFTPEVQAVIDKYRSKIAKGEPFVESEARREIIRAGGYKGGVGETDRAIRLIKAGAERVGAERKFPLGQLVMTRGVNDLVAENADFAKFATESLRRHARGDWGDLSEEDKRENEYALDKRLRLFSAYEKPPLPKIWIITEADRSVTTILFPEEY